MSMNASLGNIFVTMMLNVSMSMVVSIANVEQVLKVVDSMMSEDASILTNA